jgi:hypothetical protein
MENEPTPAEGISSEKQETSGGRRPSACSAFWWALSLAISYAQDNCFTLSETTEWHQMHEIAGLPKDATNDEIQAKAHAELAAMGWKWTAFDPKRWIHETNK